MALIPIVKPKFPSVPQLPGVPPLIRNAASPVQAVSAFRSIALGFFQRFITTEAKWGIYSKEGKKLVNADSFMSFDFSFDTSISKHPVQNGGFANYNKVQQPYEVTVRVVKAGSLNGLSEALNIIGGGKFGGAAVQDRTGFLVEIDKLCKSLDLVSIVTPEASYVNVNAKRYSFRREQTNGAYQIIADIVFEKVREVTPAYTNIFIEQSPTQTGTPKNPDAQPTKNIGKVQAQEIPDKSILKSLLEGGLSQTFENIKKLVSK